IDDDVRLLKSANSPADDLACSVLELLINHVLLNLADALIDGLAGSLGGDATEILRRHLDLEFLAGLDIGLGGSRLRDEDLVMGILDAIDRDQFGERTNRTGLRIDVDTKFTGTRGEAFLGCRQKGAGNRLDENFAFNASF